MLASVSNQRCNKNEIVKRENNEKDDLIENCWNRMNFVLQIEPKTLDPNFSFSFNTLHYKPILL